MEIRSLPGWYFVLFTLEAFVPNIEWILERKTVKADTFIEHTVQIVWVIPVNSEVPGPILRLLANSSIIYA